MAPETTQIDQKDAWFGWMEASTTYSHFPLRMALFSVFLFHAVDKLSNGVEGFAATVGLPIFAAWLVVLAEFGIAGLAVYGAFARAPGSDNATRVAGVITMVIMTGAIGMMHWENGWHFMKNGMEFQVTLTLLGLYFFLRGNRI